MPSTRRVFYQSIVVLGFLALSGVAFAQTIPELFSKMKEQVKAEKWADALVTIEVIDVAAAKPENASMRSQLAGPLAFYRGVCDANLGSADKAQSDFETFLNIKPDAGIDDKVYSKKAVAAFQAAQKAVASQGPSIARAYANFQPPPSKPDPANAAWGDGPVKWLFTDAEKSAWAAAATDEERAAFVEKFWKARTLEDDPSFRPAFEKRVAFADENFKQGETRGSLTDRGMVFVLLGPPTYGGRRRIGAKEDTSENAGMSTVGDHDAAIAQAKQAGASSKANSLAGGSARPNVSGGQVASLDDQFRGPGTQAASSDKDYQEVWHYRKDLLPKGVSYLQVDAVFITKKGYGQNVLQRDADVLATLNAAKQKPQ
jgi:GWxTD domain-containing protein